MSSNIKVLEDEILSLGSQIGDYAIAHGMDKKKFLESLESMDVEVAIAVKPLLERRIYLLKQLWKARTQENMNNNLLLFTRTT